MGCYGIGVERMLAAAIEANHDANGIIWPRDLAPYDVHVVALNLDQPEVAAVLEALDVTIGEAGLTVLIDDRADSAGIKFKDADLLGMPVRLTVSPRAMEKGGVEFRNRTTGETRVVPNAEVVAEVRLALDAARSATS